jgi:hypothetical protein
MSKVRSKLLVEQGAVIETKQVSRDLTLVRLALSSTDVALVAPGSHVAVAVAGPTKSPLGAWRRFTVNGSGAFGDGRTWLSWLAFSGQDGARPAARFHNALRAGSTVSVRLSDADPTVDAVVRRCQWDGSELLCVGDETAIGLFSSFVAFDRIHLRALLVVNDPSSGFIPNWPGERDGCGAFSTKGELLAELHRWAPGMVSNSGSALVVVGGKALVGEVRSLARAAGIGRNRVAARVYWAPGKVGPE